MSKYILPWLALMLPILVNADALAATCGVWRQQCFRLYGYGSPAWNACMSQPQAQYDCGAGDGYGSGGGCANSNPAKPGKLRKLAPTVRQALRLSIGAMARVYAPTAGDGGLWPLLTN